MEDITVARKAKVSDDERLDGNSIERVIKYLSEKGATKKVACQMLNIAYNTTRLDKVIEQYKLKKDSDAKRRAEKRGTPATEAEINFVISEYLEGNTIDSIKHLRNLVDELSDRGKRIMICSHSSIPQDLIDKCECYFYDSNNLQVHFV